MENDKKLVESLRIMGNVLSELAADRIEELSQENAALKEKLDLCGKWQPIETAPKDGTEILVYAKTRPADKSMTVAYWTHFGWTFSEKLDLFFCIDEEDGLTHWRYLPPLPEGTEAL